MNAQALIDSLRRFPETITAMTADLPADVYQQRGPDGQWSISEIVGHLVDEEHLDFPVRLRLTLKDPTADWPPIDPEKTVRDNDWQHNSLKRMSAMFARKRADNVAQLSTIEEPDWSSTHTHPKFGSMSAGELLASWAAHDFLHLRQMTRRLFEVVQGHAGQFSTDYAGQWS